MRNADLLRFALRHPLGSRAPLRTLARIADWQIRCRLSPVVGMKWVNGSTLRAARREAGATGNFYFGFMEPYDMGFLAHLLRPGDLFVDGGANVGAYTVLASAIGAEIHAFEPAAETLPRLRENVAANGCRATVHPVALGQASGDGRFHSGRDAQNALSADGTVVVPIEPLDAFALSPVAIKLDLEGGEEAALRGASQTLSSPGLLAVLVETVSPASRSLLGEAGLVRRWYDPFARRLLASPVGRPSNELWLREEAVVAERLRTAKPVRLGGRDLFAS